VPGPSTGGQAAEFRATTAQSERFQVRRSLACPNLAIYWHILGHFGLVWNLLYHAKALIAKNLKAKNHRSADKKMFSPCRMLLIGWPQVSMASNCLLITWKSAKRKKQQL